MNIKLKLNLLSEISLKFNLEPITKNCSVECELCRSVFQSIYTVLYFEWRRIKTVLHVS